MKISVLGGSSPFTAGFLNALAGYEFGRSASITLFGRNKRTMDNLCQLGNTLCSRFVFDWTDDVDIACKGFDIIINQIRFGGLEGRTEDERLAIALGAPPDESIGPAGLNRALAMRDALLELGRRIARGSKKAHVINLTNPLGLSTSLLHHAGVANPLGICELPVITAQKIAALLGHPYEALDWHYTGLNHRGFLHDLSLDGRSVLALLACRAQGADLGGLNGDQILSFGAVPTKYFRLFSVGTPVSAAGRSQLLAGIRDRIDRELAEHNQRLPPSLSERDQPWWSEAVLPLLAALDGVEPRRLVLNCVDRDGLTHEALYDVSSTAIKPVTARLLAEAPMAWMQRFRAHESACLHAVLTEDPEAIAKAIAIDPLLDQSDAIRRFNIVNHVSS